MFWSGKHKQSQTKLKLIQTILKKYGNLWRQGYVTKTFIKEATEIGRSSFLDPYRWTRRTSLQNPKLIEEYE